MTMMLVGTRRIRSASGARYRASAMTRVKGTNALTR